MKKFKKIRIFAKNNKAGIYMGAGVATSLVAIYMAVNETFKAAKKINAIETTEHRKLSKKEIVKVCWRGYIPTVGTEALAIGCLLGSHAASVKKTAAFATAYKISEKALDDYKDAVVKTVGDKKETEIVDTVAKKQVHDAGEATDANTIIVGESPTQIFLDASSGRYFKSDMETVKSKVNRFNKHLLEDECLSLNDYYYDLNLDSIDVGNALGWNVGNERLVEINYSAAIMPTGQPCIVMNFRNKPVMNFESVFR